MIFHFHEKIMWNIWKPKLKILFSIKPTKLEEMREIVKTLKNSKSAGPNSIPTRILKINK